MATARSTTNSDIHSQLNGYVTDYLTKHMYDANTSWPLRKTIRLPKQAELEAHYTHIRAQDEAIRNWAQQHHCETSEKTKIISNGIVRQTSQLIDSVTIPDLNTALNITTPQTRKLYQREHQRAHTITNQFNLDSNTSINIAKSSKPRRHRLQPRHTSRTLLRQPQHRKHDPTHGPHPRIQRKMARQNNIKPLQSNLQTPQTRTTSPQRPPRRNPTPTPRHTTPQPTRPHRDTTMDRRAPHDITHIIIVENKDTYQAIPTTEHAICIFGSGHAATRIKTLLPWITTTPHIIYWGDIDADGLEILSELRQTGITCDSILMDSTAYKTYEPYGTKLDTKKQPLKTRDPKPTPGLTQHERNLYEQLCTGKNTTYLRIEQERIPINDAMTILHNQHQWNTTHHK